MLMKMPLKSQDLSILYKMPRTRKSRHNSPKLLATIVARKATTSLIVQSQRRKMK